MKMSPDFDRLIQLRDVVDNLRANAYETSPFAPAIELLSFMESHEDSERYLPAIRLLEEAAFEGYRKRKQLSVAEETYNQVFDRVYPDGIELRPA